MRRVWSDENRFAQMLRVELASLAVLTSDGVVPGHEFTDIVDRATFTVEQVREKEKELKHETAAFVAVVGESAGSAGARWLHYGLTSSDVTDTAAALQVRAAGELIDDALHALSVSIASVVRRYRFTPAAARTHGRRATGTTFGVRAASWYAEVVRAHTRMQSALDQMAVGKISGPVGINDVVSRDQERRALMRLGLSPESGGMQVVSRDRYAHLLATMAVVAGTIERIAENVRLMSQSEVAEVSEGRSVRQQGSSAMPHKVNPVRSERIAGLCRVIRSYAHSVLESQALWYERDLTHSSVERVVLPDAFALLEFVVTECEQVVSSMQVDTESVARHYHSPELQSAALLSALIECGYARQLAHTAISFASEESARSGRSLLDCLCEELDIAETDTALSHLLQAVDGERAVAAAASTAERIIT
jgi:adenylosuccinate lyase